MTELRYGVILKENIKTRDLIGALSSGLWQQSSRARGIAIKKA